MVVAGTFHSSRVDCLMSLGVDWTLCSLRSIPSQNSTIFAIQCCVFFPFIIVSRPYKARIGASACIDQTNPLCCSYCGSTWVLHFHEILQDCLPVCILSLTCIYMRWHIILYGCVCECLSMCEYIYMFFWQCISHSLLYIYLMFSLTFNCILYGCLEDREDYYTLGNIRKPQVFLCDLHRNNNIWKSYSLCCHL